MDTYSGWCKTHTKNAPTTWIHREISSSIDPPIIFVSSLLLAYSILANSSESQELCRQHDALWWPWLRILPHDPLRLLEKTEQEVGKTDETRFYHVVLLLVVWIRWCGRLSYQTEICPDWTMPLIHSAVAQEFGGCDAVWWGCKHVTASCK